MTNKVSIAAAICTFNRPALLRTALKSVLNQVVPSALVQIIVVDNDANESAREIVESLMKQYEYISYFVEPSIGITYARNRAIQECIKLHIDLLAFFDDDAQAETDWLKNLFITYKENYPCIVTGPQYSIISENAPGWVKKSIYFNPKPVRYGTERNWAASNNVMFPIKYVEKFNLAFDVKLNSSGGSDQLFFMEFKKKTGLKIIWCDKAIVREFVDPQRLNLKWLLKRNFRYSSSGAYFHRKIDGVIAGSIISLLKGFYYLLFGIILSIFSFFLPKLLRFQGYTYLARGLGWFSGLFGNRVKQYT